MATYPSIGLTHDIRPRTARRMSVSDSGAVRIVDLGESTVFDIAITHPIINSTDRDTLLAFYASYKDVSNEITLAGDTYTVYFTGDYRIESVSASYFTLSVELVGTRQ